MSPRLLVVHPGHGHSTHDVYTGLVGGLRANGAEVIPYLLAGRLSVAEAWLRYCDRKTGGRLLNWRALSPRERITAVAAKACEEVVTRALRHDVDGVLLISGMFATGDLLTLLQRARLPVGAVLTESPYDDEHQARLAARVNICWTNDRASLAVLRRANPRTYYLPAAHDPAVHSAAPQPDDAALPAHDVVFVGTLFPERVRLLETVDWSGVDLGLYGYAGGPLRRRAHPLRRYLHEGPIDNRQAAALYRRARLGLNLYRAHPAAESLNPRAYELAACGCCQLSEWRAELADVFPGGGVLAVHRPIELAGALRQALDRPDWRATAAARAAAAVAPHTFAARAAQLLDDFAPVLAGNLAVAYG